MLIDGRPCTDLLAGAPGRGGTGEAYLLLGSTGARRARRPCCARPTPRRATRSAPRWRSRRARDPGHDLWIGAPGRDVAGPGRRRRRLPLRRSPRRARSPTPASSPRARARRPGGGRPARRGARADAGGVLAGLPHEDAGTGATRARLMLLRAGGGRACRRLRTRATASAPRSPTPASGSPPARRAPTSAAATTPASSTASAHARARAARTARASAACPAAPRPATASAARSRAGWASAARRTSRSRSACRARTSAHARDAGAVTLLEGGDITDCRSRELAQGRGLRGRPHRRARIGATLGIAPDLPGSTRTSTTRCSSGVPAGGILTAARRLPRPARRGSAAPRGAPGYGSVFALPS